MDGNNRWATKNNKKNFYSYSLGANNIIKLSNYIFSKTETKYISAFALSSSNLKRPQKIINSLKKILLNFLNNEITKNEIGFRIKFIGDLSFLDKEILRKIKLIEKRNPVSGNILSIFLNYSGRQDVIQAFSTIKKLSLNNLNDELLKKCLLTNELPDPDILIRTGGFQRISDFMLYQLSFTEFFFLKKLWNDFSTSDISKIITKYKKINRKFGV